MLRCINESTIYLIETSLFAVYVQIAEEQRTFHLQLCISTHKII